LNNIFNAYNVAIKTLFKLFQPISMYVKKIFLLSKRYYIVSCSWFSRSSLSSKNNFTNNSFSDNSKSNSNSISISNSNSAIDSSGDMKNPLICKNKKNLLERVVATRGIKLGYHTPNLPSQIIELQNRLYIRILRFVGGICVMYVLYSRLEGSQLMFKFLARCRLKNFLF